MLTGIFFALFLFALNFEEIDYFACSFTFESEFEQAYIDGEIASFENYEEFFLPFGRHEISFDYKEQVRAFSFYVGRSKELQRFFIPKENFLEIKLSSLNEANFIFSNELRISTLDRFEASPYVLIKETVFAKAQIAMPVIKIPLDKAIKLENLFLFKMAIFSGSEEIFKKYFPIPSKIESFSDIFPKDLTIQIESDEKISIVDSDWFAMKVSSVEKPCEMIMPKSIEIEPEELFIFEITEESTPLELLIKEIDLGEPPYKIYILSEEDFNLEFMNIEKGSTDTNQ
jgi:hypothetical protein